MWLRSLLRLLGRPQSNPTTIGIHAIDSTMIHCDNQSAITLTKSGSFHGCSKHIDVKYHYIHERVECGDIFFRYLPTTEMTADVLTKALARPKHAKFTEQMGLEGYNVKG
jgi:hypothetical protein